MDNNNKMSSQVYLSRYLVEYINHLRFAYSILLEGTKKIIFSFFKDFFLSSNLQSTHVTDI